MSYFRSEGEEDSNLFQYFLGNCIWEKNYIICKLTNLLSDFPCTC